MTDFEYFQTRVKSSQIILDTYGYKLTTIEINDKLTSINKYNISFEFINIENQITALISMRLFPENDVSLSFSFFNENEETQNQWRSFFLSDYLKDFQLEDQFKTKIKPGEDVQAGIDEFFKNLEFALKDYLRPYVTGQTYIDHHARLMDEYYSNVAVDEMQNNAIEKAIQKKGLLFRLKQSMFLQQQKIWHWKREAISRLNRFLSGE